MFQTLIHTSLRNAIGENLNVFESSGDTDSEFMRFQFGRSSFTKLSQSNVRCRHNGFRTN